MTPIELKPLVFVLIGVDIAIVFFIVALIRKLRSLNGGKALHEGAEIFESLLADADKVSDRLKEELGAKHRLMEELNQKLDGRVMSLTLLLNRADCLLSCYEGGVCGADNAQVLKEQEKEILRLAKQGLGFKKIAQILEIPSGEVKLVLGLKKRVPQTAGREGLS